MFGDTLLQKEKKIKGVALQQRKHSKRCDSDGVCK